VMNASSQAQVSTRGGNGAHPTTVQLDSSSSRKSDHTPAIGAKGSKAVDCRVSALKALALTLLAEIESLESADPQDKSDLDLQAEVRRFEAELIRSALVTTHGRQRRAARLLGMKVTTLNAKIRRYEIDIPRSHATCSDAKMVD
jgi:DNA-binding NtrC family response regulator